MKLRPILEDFRAAIAPLDTAELRALYINLDPAIPRIELAKDLSMRYRWDLFYRTPQKLRNRLQLEFDPNDSHIDTMLRAIVPAL